MAGLRMVVTSQSDRRRHATRNADGAGLRESWAARGGMPRFARIRFGAVLPARLAAALAQLRHYPAPRTVYRVRSSAKATLA